MGTHLIPTASDKEGRGQLEQWGRIRKRTPSLKCPAPRNIHTHTQYTSATAGLPITAMKGEPMPAGRMAILASLIVLQAKHTLTTCPGSSLNIQSEVAANGQKKSHYSWDCVVMDCERNFLFWYAFLSVCVCVFLSMCVWSNRKWFHEVAGAPAIRSDNTGKREPAACCLAWTPIEETSLCL